MSSGVTAVCSQGCLQARGGSANLKAKNARLSKSSQTPSGEKRKNSRSKERVPVEVAERVLARDAKRCRSCNGVAWLHLHHIRYRSQGGPHTEANLITLCEECHRMVHSSKRKWQSLLLEVLRLQEEDNRKVTVLQLDRRSKQT